jgi:hypothetical protein
MDVSRALGGSVGCRVHCDGFWMREPFW